MAWMLLFCVFAPSLATDMIRIPIPHTAWHPLRFGSSSRLILRGGIDQYINDASTAAQQANSEEEEAKLLGLLKTHRMSRSDMSPRPQGEGCPSVDDELQSTRQLLARELPLLFKRPSTEFSDFIYLPEVFRYLTRSANPEAKFRVTTSQFSLKVR